MGNPAYELLELIDTWSDDGPIPLRRGQEINDETGLDFWETQKKAIALLSEVEQFLRDDGEAEDDLQVLVDAWLFLLPARQDWCMDGVFPAMPPAVRAFIRQVGRRIDETSVPITKLLPGQLQALRETLLELREQLGELSQLPTEVRDRLLELVGDALRLLDDEGTPLAVACSKTYEVVGAAIAVTLELPEEGRTNFFGRLLRLSGIWLSNMSAGAVGNVLTAGIDPTKLLGS